MKNLDDYMAKRDGSGAQSIIHQRKMNMLEMLLKSADSLFVDLFDCPCDYGPLTDNISRQSNPLVSSDLNSTPLATHYCSFIESMEGSFGAPCDITRLPFKDRAFEGMVTFRLFHHLADSETRKAVFSEAARVSRRFFLITYYRRNFFNNFLQRLNRKVSICNGRKALLYPSRIIEEASHAGWQFIESYRVFPAIRSKSVAFFLKAAPSLTGW
jgi:hypothetical protein